MVSDSVASCLSLLTSCDFPGTIFTHLIATV